MVNVTSEVLEAGDPSEEDSSCKETGNPIIKSFKGLSRQKNRHRSGCRSLSESFIHLSTMCLVSLK